MTIQRWWAQRQGVRTRRELRGVGEAAGL